MVRVRLSAELVVDVVGAQVVDHRVGEGGVDGDPPEEVVRIIRRPLGWL